MCLSEVPRQSFPVSPPPMTITFLSLAEIKFHDTDEIDVQTNKALGNKCPVCWKISEEPCQRHGH